MVGIIQSWVVPSSSIEARLPFLFLAEACSFDRGVELGVVDGRVEALRRILHPESHSVA